MTKITLIVIQIFIFINIPDGQPSQSDKNEIGKPKEILTKDGFEKARAWFNKTDVNHDDVISREEFPIEFNNLWDLVDTDKNGLLTLKEELLFQIKEQEKQFLSEMSQENRILTIQKNLGLPKRNRIQDLTGEWLCFTTMSDHGNPGNGIMYINLSQNGITLNGELQQLKFPNSIQIFGINTTKEWAAEVHGQLILSTGNVPGHNLIILHRKNIQNNFQAIFSGFVSADGDSIVAQLVNNGGNYGTMLMVKRLQYGKNK